MRRDTEPSDIFPTAASTSVSVDGVERSGSPSFFVFVSSEQITLDLPQHNHLGPEIRVTRAPVREQRLRAVLESPWGAAGLPHLGPKASRPLRVLPIRHDWSRGESNDAGAWLGRTVDERGSCSYEGLPPGAYRAIASLEGIQYDLGLFDILPGEVRVVSFDRRSCNLPRTSFAEQR